MLSTPEPVAQSVVVTRPTRLQSRAGRPCQGLPGSFRRKVALALLAGLAPVIAGCNLNYQRPVEPAMNPNGSDEAQARRKWEQTDALYANSGVKAYANRARYNYETASTQVPAVGVLFGPLAFVGQSILFPFTFLRSAPGATQVYRPLAVEPSFTLNPERAAQGPAIGNVVGAGAGEGPTNAAGTPLQSSAPGVTPGGNTGGLPANPLPGNPRPSGAGGGAGGIGGPGGTGGGAGGAGGGR